MEEKIKELQDAYANLCAKVGDMVYTHETQKRAIFTQLDELNKKHQTLQEIAEKKKEQEKKEEPKEEVKEVQDVKTEEVKNG
jgi:hypothetical protein